MSISLRITRDSVCMGDDVDAPHEQILQIFKDDPLSILREVIRRYPLATIAGGKATWECQLKEKTIAIVAQEWPEPRFIGMPEEICSGAGIHFVYRAQQPPERFLPCL